MPNLIPVDEGTINSLKVTIERERNIFDTTKSILSELEQKEEIRRLSQMQVLLSSMYKLRANRARDSEIKSPMVHEQSSIAIDEFLIMEKQSCIEALNFLLSEFFTHAYPGKRWDDIFIANLVHEVGRAVNLISAIEKD